MPESRGTTLRLPATEVHRLVQQVSRMLALVDQLLRTHGTAGLGDELEPELRDTAQHVRDALSVATVTLEGLVAEPGA